MPHGSLKSARLYWQAHETARRHESVAGLGAVSHRGGIRICSLVEYWSGYRARHRDHGLCGFSWICSSDARPGLRRDPSCLASEKTQRRADSLGRPLPCLDRQDHSQCSERGRSRFAIRCIAHRRFPTNSIAPAAVPIEMIPGFSFCPCGTSSRLAINSPGSAALHLGLLSQRPTGAWQPELLHLPRFPNACSWGPGVQG